MVPSFSLGSFQEHSELRPAAMAHRPAWGHWTLLALLLTAVCAIQAVPAADGSNTTETGPAPTTAAAGTSTAVVQSHHKPLMPLIGTDIGLFIVIAVALFIASGAGVGGGALAIAHRLATCHQCKRSDDGQ